MEDKQAYNLLPPSHYDSCIENGIRLYRQLESFETTALARNVDIDTYICTSARLSCPDRALRHGLLDLGIDPGFRFVDVSDDPQGLVIYSNWFSLGTIVANENYKSRDLRPEHQKIFPSEALWQSFLLASREDALVGSPENLRTIVRSNIVNQSCRTAIWYAARRSTCTSEGEKGYKVYTEFDNGFFAILGSQNGASTMRLLLDHKRELGFPKVEKVIVFSCREAGDENDNGLSRTIAVILSEKRETGH